MRVAIVCPYAWDRFGGVQSHVRSLARTLRERAHDVLVIAPRGSGHPVPEEGVAFAGRAMSVPANGSVAPISFGPAASARVRNELRRFKPDVLHVHEPLIPSISLLSLLSAEAPVVGTFHASSERSLGYALAKPVLQLAIKKLSVRTAVSDAARAFARRYFPGDYALTPNGVEVDVFASAEPADIGPRSILFLGRIERRKGLEVLIQAMTRLRDLDATVVVAGDGPERAASEALARRLEVPVRFLGSVPNEDVPRLFAGATVYCAPGIGGESFGIVLVEAMAAGAPIVCSDLPGYHAVAGGAARLVKPGDAGELAAALRAVVGDAAERERMKKQSRRMASLFDWSRLAANVEGVYERATGAG